MKIVWLCHFSNEEINNCFGTNTNEFAPWISELIRLFEKNEDIEINIVAPNVFNNKNKSFKIRGINYHFFTYSPKWFDFRYFEQYRIGYLTGFYHSLKNATKIIEDIKPDLIHLHGAENPYYSLVMLNFFMKIQCFTTIQGFAIKTTQRNILFDYFRIKRCEIEKIILEKSKYIGVRTDEMAELAHKINPLATLCWHNYPINIPILDNFASHEKKYDIAFYARVCEDKGIEDLISAMPLIKKELKEIQLVIIGGGTPRYLKHLLHKIKHFKLEENVIFAGFQKKQEDAYKILCQSRLYVLPTFHDIIPGTLIECMYLKMPSVSYKVGGIPSLNKDREGVVLVEKGDINELATSIIRILNNNAYASTIANNAYITVSHQFNNDQVYSDLTKAYDDILFKK